MYVCGAELKGPMGGGTETLAGLLPCAECEVAAKRLRTGSALSPQWKKRPCTEESALRYPEHRGRDNTESVCGHGHARSVQAPEVSFNQPLRQVWCAQREPEALQLYQPDVVLPAAALSEEMLTM